MLVLVTGLPAALSAVACDRAAGERDEVVFEGVDAEPPAGALRVEGDPAEARLLLLDALDDREGAPALVAGDGWRTVVAVRGGADAREVAARGHTYVLRGESELQLEVRLGAGDRGGYAGDVVETGAERAMIEIQLADPRTVGARFDITLVADDGVGGSHPRDVTPRHLTRDVPAGTYRAWVDVPPRGGRYLVSVAVVSRTGDAVGHAWSSPIAVERPWL